MSDSSKPPSSPSWASQVARSDHLPVLLSYVAPALQQLGVAGVHLRLRAVLDTSTILADLFWLAARRKQNDARTALMEAIAAKVVIACAPPRVEDEVRGNLADLSEQTGVSEGEIWALWVEYKRLLTIVDPTAYETRATRYLRGRDPSDIPFIHTSETVQAAAVLTSDPDILDADARALPAREIVIDLRNYARAKTIELTIVGLGTFTISTSLHVLGGAIRTLPAVARAIARLPRWLHVTVACGIIWVLASKERREAAGRLLQRARTAFGNVFDVFLEQTKELLTIAVTAHAQAAKASADVIAKAPPRKIRLREAVFLACSDAKGPLAVAEIDEAVRGLGYGTKAKHLGPAILRTLRHDHRFEQVADDRWGLRRRDAEEVVTGHGTRPDPAARGF